MSKLTVGVFNDSFPPTIDGVSNVTFNYATELQKKGAVPVVATPWYPNTEDDYPFEVIRYPSAYVSGRLGYRAGYPFDPRILWKLNKANLDLIHTHCPFISTVLARTARVHTSTPIIFTYHTKFDIDIDKVLALNPARNASIKFLLNNINACDEVWTVSKGAGENLKSLGYTGEYRIVPNGTDFVKGRATEHEVETLRASYGLSRNMPVLLYVGRMMWYKGVRLSLDALRTLKNKNIPFRMFLIGDGYDRVEIEAYAKEIGLTEECIFTGAIHDRELLRTYFSMAQLFVFPSTYDTNGIVVNEAAACSCPSLLIRGSCAAERVSHNESGLLSLEDPAELSYMIEYALSHPDFTKKLGENAAKHVYLHWSSAVSHAHDLYEEILESFVPGLDLRYPAYVFFEEVQHLKDDIGETRDFLKHYYKKQRQTLRALPLKHHFKHSLDGIPFKKVLHRLGLKR